MRHQCVQFAPFAHLFAADPQRHRHVPNGFHLELVVVGGGSVEGHLRVTTAGLILVMMIIVAAFGTYVAGGGAALVDVFEQKSAVAKQKLNNF